jgi:chloride channel protein, CIC family
VSAVLLAIELLLFEYRPRSLLPVALAATAATAVRIAKYGAEPVFALPDVAQPGGEALAFYVVLGAFLGLASIVATRAVYAVEDAFARLPIHWMWWPALGGLCVGLVGYLQPRTLGVGYSNIEDILGGHLSLGFVAVLCSAKFVSWVFALGSGTSGGTLAPLFTFGSGMGALLGSAAAMALPSLGVDPRIAALVGMAALFAGASRALLASVVFAFETTRQPIGLLPLLGGCSAAFLTSSLLMKHSIMTEKIARRGVRVSGEYTVDPLEQMGVRDFAARGVVCLQGADTLRAVKDWLLSGAPGSQHQGFPVLDAECTLRSVVTRAEVLGIGAEHDAEPLQAVLNHPAITVDEDCSLRQAADTMAREGIGRLPVVRRELPRQVIAIITRSDLIGAHVL